MTQNTAQSARRYDLDALRVIAFALLIFYHVGMAYSGWDWHVLSAYAGEAGGEVIQPLMRALNPWRLPLLFLISGAALCFAIDKAGQPDAGGIWRFLRARSWRLFAPLLFGMLIIVAPQSWLQLLANGETQAGFFRFYPGYLTDIYSITTPTWNHLWYVAYMLVYTPLIILLARPLRGISKRLNGIGLLALVFVPHMIIRLALDPYFPTTHDLTGDWANHAHSFMWVMTGFMIAKSPRAWSMIATIFPWSAMLAAALCLYLGHEWIIWDSVSQQPVRLWIARVGRVAYTAIVILALLGAAQRWLSTPSRVLSWAGSSVFCWYILHQTLIVMGVVWLGQYKLGLALEGTSLIVLTTVLTLGLTEVFRRTGPFAVLWGFKPRAKTKPANYSSDPSMA